MNDQDYFVKNLDGKLLAQVCLNVDLLMEGDNKELMESVKKSWRSQVRKNGSSDLLDWTWNAYQMVK